MAKKRSGKSHKGERKAGGSSTSKPAAASDNQQPVSGEQSGIPSWVKWTGIGSVLGSLVLAGAFLIPWGAPERPPVEPPTNNVTVDDETLLRGVNTDSYLDQMKKTSAEMKKHIKAAQAEGKRPIIVVLEDHPDPECLAKEAGILHAVNQYGCRTVMHEVPENLKHVEIHNAHYIDKMSDQFGMKFVATGNPENAKLTARDFEDPQNASRIILANFADVERRLQVGVDKWEKDADNGEPLVIYTGALHGHNLSKKLAGEKRSVMFINTSMPNAGEIAAYKRMEKSQDPSERALFNDFYDKGMQFYLHPEKSLQVRDPIGVRQGQNKHGEDTPELAVPQVKALLRLLKHRQAEWLAAADAPPGALVNDPDAFAGAAKDNPLGRYES